MAMNHGWRRAVGPPPPSHQFLGTHDCDSAIGELVLRGDVARLFAPSGFDWPDYNATLALHDGRRVVVKVYSTADGSETRFGEGWRHICEDLDLNTGDLDVFRRIGQEQHRTFTACFRDADGNERLRRRYGALDDPPSSPEFQVNADLLRARDAEARRGEQVAGAAGGGGDRALQLQVDDMTIKEAMDLAVECGAREGSDEHYMATKLFVKAENRAMFLTFRTNAGRLQWLSRCYGDCMN